MAEASGRLSTTNSRTVADTIVGEHEHTICGYSLLKGIGDGEPVASDRFSVGGHEWVLLFYPDGKKSSHADPGQVYPRPQVPNIPFLGQRDGDGQNGNQGAEARGDEQHGGGAGAVAGADVQHGADGPGEHRQAQAAADNGAHQHAAAPHAHQGQQNQYDHAPAHQQAAQHQQPPPQQVQQAQQAPDNAAVAAVQAVQAAAGMFPAPPPLNFHVHVPAQQPPANIAAAQMAQNRGRRNEVNEYCALFVALIGEGKDPQGVINTSDGKVVRAFHRFTLVDQKSGRDIMKGRQRADGAVKISCARQDPNARNCHGYRKFVKKSVLEDPDRGFLLDDRIVIRYTIELVVSQGGALQTKGTAQQSKIEVPPPTIGADFSTLLHDEGTCDVAIHIINDADGDGDGEEGSQMEGGAEPERARTVRKAHKLVLKARSSVFRTMLSAGMQEGETGVITIGDMQPDVFEALLHFVYSDELPESLQDGKMAITMAQHLLMASDRYQLERLRAICERRLVDTVDIDTVSTTLMLADKCNALNLRQVCLTYVASNLSQVINTQEYKRLCDSCSGMLNEILAAVAKQGSQAVARPANAPRTAPVQLARRIARRRDED